MIKLSLAIAPAGPLSEIWYLSDYWQRDTITRTTIGVEDFIFSFLIGGITFALYKTIHRKALSKRKTNKSRYSMLFIVIMSCLAMHIILSSYLDINSVIVSVIFFLLAFLIFVVKRPDLIRPGLLSGVYVAGLLFISYEFLELLMPGTLSEWCLQCNPTQIMIFDVNIEEIAWDFTWGAFGGVLYEAISGRKMVPLKRH